MASREIGREDTRVEKFTGENFHLWKFKLMMLLEKHDLWGIVDGTEVLPEGATNKARQEFHKRERRAMAEICLSLGDTQLPFVMTAKTAKEAWKKLEDHYEKKSLANKLFLRKKFFTAVKLEGDSMVSHINKMKTLAAQMEAVGAPVTEDDVVTTLLCSLPEDYSNLITALEARMDDLNLEFVAARLLHEEMKKEEMNGGASRKETGAMQGGETALVAHQKWQRYENGRVGEAKQVCHYCGRPGHFIKHCRSKMTDEKAYWCGGEQGVQDDLKNIQQNPAKDDDLLF